MYVYRNGNKIQINPKQLANQEEVAKQVPSPGPSGPGPSGPSGPGPVNNTWGWVVIGILSAIALIIVILIIVGLFKKRKDNPFVLKK
jgi:hypothetical protein